MLGLAVAFPAPQASAQTWIGGEMGYRVTAIPEASAAAGAGLRVADVLAKPQLLPDRLASAGPEGVEIPIYVIRWYAESNDFKTTISRRRFVK